MRKKTAIEASIERKCAFCEYGTIITLSTGQEQEMICEKKGLVPLDHVCRSFRYDLLKRDPKKTVLEESETSIDD